MFKKAGWSGFITLLLVSALGLLSACNTIEGAGKDIEKGGKAVKDTANESK
jgi:entericidin B